VKKRHAILISLLLGVAVVLGVMATVRTTGLAQSSSFASPAALSAGRQRLDLLQAQIRRARASHPPALPAAPRSVTSAVAPRVRYVRAEPINVVPSKPQYEHDDEGWEEESDD
jgi:hypothetical protein